VDKAQKESRTVENDQEPQINGGSFLICICPLFEKADG